MEFQVRRPGIKKGIDTVRMLLDFGTAGQQLGRNFMFSMFQSG
jgi:hypothetical protein